MAVEHPDPPIWGPIASTLVAVGASWFDLGGETKPVVVVNTVVFCAANEPIRPYVA